MKLLLTSLFLAMTMLVSLPAAAEEKALPPVIHIAMTAAFVSEKGVDIYKEITEYLAARTGFKTEFVNGLSYSTVNAMIEQGAVHMAFVCGYPYVLSHDGKAKPPAKLLVAPVHAGALYKGEPKYYSYVIVHRDSPITRFEELKGKRFAYNDKISNSGYNMPRAKLIALDATKGFFSRVLHSGSHEQSMRMVAEKKADASAVDSLVLDYALSHDEPYAKQVKIIETLGPAGIPPVIYSTTLPEETVTKLKDALLEMQNDPQGQLILKKANLKGFVTVDDRNYDDIRQMEHIAQKTGYMVIR